MERDDITALAGRFPLPWSHYVRLLAVRNPEARRFYETEAPELGGDFAFVGRQRRLRVGDEWYRLDLLFFHRRPRCLIIIIDLELETRGRVARRHPKRSQRGQNS